MNRYGKELVESLNASYLSAHEYRQQLIKTRNMGLLCHCSAEIGLSALSYFGVNGMILNRDGDYYVLLISNITPLDPEEEAGLDTNSRPNTYALVEKLVHEVFDGKYTFYSAELDGRLVVLICFMHGAGALVRNGLEDKLIAAAAKLAGMCRERFDIEIVSFLSRIVHGINTVSSEYHKMMNISTYYRFVERATQGGVVDKCRQPGDSPPKYLPVDLARELAYAILNNGDYISCADSILARMAGDHIHSIADLESQFSYFVEFLCKQLSENGLIIDSGQIRLELFPVMEVSVHWREVVRWFYGFLRDIAARYANMLQTAQARKIEVAKLYIDEHFTDAALSVSDIADYLGISQGFLSASFKKQENVSISGYIQNKRLNAACELLQSTYLSIKEICEQTGFGSETTFYRNFRREYGVSPGASRYRKQEIAVFPKENAAADQMRENATG